jgi:hypothetical protein
MKADAKVGDGLDFAVWENRSEQNALGECQHPWKEKERMARSRLAAQSCAFKYHLASDAAQSAGGWLHLIRQC